MHSDVHLQLHALRAAELRTEADRFGPARAVTRTPGRLRGRLGWLLVEVGLRLVHSPRAHTARTA
ncbi:hypothetical protein [Streptomyces sp. NPDC058665]|uniref:hypothetical protein n=1 Tax=Streptomyces sp. NPDC058665 TaxID=3346586 RepID=UPI00365E122A